MTRSEIFEKLQPLFQEILDPNLILTEDLDASTVPTWDSLNHITLIVAIEGMMGIEMTSKELAELRSVGDMVTLLQKKATSRREAL